MREIYDTWELLCGINVERHESYAPLIVMVQVERQANL